MSIAAAVLEAPVILISDLHLQESRPDITRAFVDFTTGLSGACRDFFVLGDLFELWLGDDAESPLAATVANTLSGLAGRGVNVYLMHGNRDFLLGADFAERCGAGLIDEPHALRVGDAQWLLLHGDVLCTDDTAYLEFRAMVRNPAWRRQFLSRPLAERRAWAERARQASREATAGKAAEIMDVNQDAVLELIRTSGCRRILHGHTHRPAVHQLPATGTSPEPAIRVVLGDWNSQGWYAGISSEGVRLESFAFPGPA